jgi:signal transduction histidine kinase
MAADEMKTEFIRTMSHEIRTPLNIINGFSQILTGDENELESEERKNIAKTISDSTHQITSLVNKMQALVNMNIDNLQTMVEEINPSEVCQRAILSMPDTDPEVIKVVFDDQTNQDGQKLTTNRDSLLQMLGNLLENAVKFTEQGQITLTLKHDKTHFHFTIEDTGCGIPADKIDTIFKRFTKVDEFKEGLGLGLAYCSETAEKLGGSLTLDKTSDEGTAFTLSLPIQIKVNK